MSTVDKTQPSTENRKNRLEFEELISDLSSRFINLKPDEVNREIETTLRRACESLGIDLAVLWQWSSLAPGAVIMPTHAYAAGWVAWLPTRIVWVEAKVGRQAAHPARPIDPGRLNGGSIAVRKKD